MDFDPRDYDSRDDERHSHTPSRGGRCTSGDHERDHDWRQPDTRTRFWKRARIRGARCYGAQSRFRLPMDSNARRRAS
jgi:hypothetical protein